MSDHYLAFYTEHYGATEGTISFETPTFLRHTDTGESLTTYFSEHRRGIGLLRHGAEFTEHRSAISTRRANEADAVYYGGRHYTDLSETEASFLAEAGYSVTYQEGAP